MSKALIFLLLALAILIFTSDVSSQLTEPSFRKAVCLGERFGNYTTNSTYESNLKTVISTLEEHASTTSFYNTSSGNGSDTVYGKYYCRGDVDSDFCKNCIHAATLHALNCSNAKGAIIWYNECTLRYENIFMYGEVRSPRLRTWSKANVTDPENFFIALNDTMIKLIDEVKDGYADRSMISHYATGEGKVSASETVYCLVQCSPDMNTTQCDTSLRAAYFDVQTCCGKYPRLVFFFNASSQLMYSLNDPFYVNRNTPPSPPSFMFLPSPPPANGASTLLVNKILKIGVVITTALAFFTLMINT